MDLMVLCVSAGTGHRRHPCHVPEPRRPYADPHRHRRWDGGDGNTKDSGIDTSSSATLSEDTHKHNVYWKLSQDGRQYVGHMTLRKELNPDGTREHLGMRVVGGHVIDEDSGTTGAIVETLKEGSLADRVGRIQPDDEVLEWNGIRLRNLYKEEVADIIGVSKNDPQVQLLVSRPCGINVPSPLDPIDGRRLPPPHMEIHPEAMQRDAPSSRYHDRHSSYPPSRNQVATIGGKIKVRVWYDPNDLQLVGTVERAIDLPPRPNQRPRTTYVRVSLLPDRGEKYRRRSKCIARSNDPQWNLSFVYTHLRQSELRNRTLQISVWDYEKNGSNDFLGEVLIPLRNLRADSQWYNLSKHREEPKDNNPSPPVSPPASRMPSDEELSDYDEKFLEHTERRIMAVDSSPPFYEEERRRQSSVPFLAPAIMPPMMGERSRSMAAPSPTVEYSRGRMREPGYGDRRRSRSMADYTTRHMPSHGSRSVSPPQYRSEFQSLPRISSAHRLMPPQNSLRKRQLPLVPARNELEERYLRGRNSVSGSTTGTYSSEYDRFAVPRRGGGSRMAAALGVSATSPLISPDRSDSESSSKFNLSSAFHRNSRTFEEFRGRSSDYGGPVHPSSREMDGSLSDTAVGLMDKAKVNVHRSTPTDSNNRSPYLSKKSRSTSQLSGAGHKKLQIFRRRNGSSSSLVVQRSEEILPDVRAGSSISSDGSISGDSLTWGSRLPPEVGEASSFVEGLGPGQSVGRQALASPYLGEVQLGICEKRNCLEVEVIRARGLLPKANSKVLPTPYIKVYLLDGRRCIAKRKTVLARRTLDPLYQQVLTFTEDFRHCCMQVTVWGNYSSMERKVFMGVVQILLDDIDLVKGVIDWYRLFHHSSLINSLTRNDRSSFLSLDSFG
ncbi:regulating synaptic membrane exocytosis protein 1 [Trichonephila clavipes]|nr:regulating synaptic membrane exocytosis protein 1 [Trichonephila clavipes]